MIKKWISRALFFFVLIGIASASPIPRSDVPDPLKAWIPWALDGEAGAGCPHLFNSGDTRTCAWPGTLELNANASGAGFTQSWTVYRETWVTLPGDEKQWPQQVTINGKPAAVISREESPSIKLPPGTHQVAGRFNWTAVPESLALADNAGVLRLTLNGAAVTLPVRDEENRLWLQRKAEAVGAEQTQVRVHRRVVDGVPIIVETRIRLEVSGKSRELTIGRALLPELIPKELVSSLPAVLAKDGSIKVQARAGTWDIVLVGRHPGPAKALTLPASEGLVAEEEVWVFQAAPLVRSATVEGPPTIDPQQTTLPAEWRSLPAYLMRPASTFGFKEIRRGDSEPSPDKLTLQRRLWLSFDGSTITVHDRLQGEISRAERLTMAAPAQLGRVDVNGQDQLITTGSDQLAGIEVKRGRLAMSADSLLPGAPRNIPAVGWKHDFDQLSTELALPPGWRLLHAGGTDRAEGAWLSRWNLLDFFLVLVIALAAGQLWGRAWGAVALAALVLTYQEPDAPRFAWLVLLAAVALVRALPDGRFRGWMVWFQRGSMLALILIILNFATNQVRTALYPVLEEAETSGNTYATASGSPKAYAESPAPMPAAAAPVAGSPPPEELLEKSADQNAAPAKSKSDLVRPRMSSSVPKPVAQNPERNYASIDPDAKVQTGPGLPDWRWHSHRLTWDGPVHQDQPLNLWLLSPWAGKFLVLLRLILLGLMLACIAGIPLRGDNGGTGGGLGRGWGARKANRLGMKLPTLVVALGLTLSAVFHVDSAQAQLPTPEHLTELKEKLMRPADCLPECADISRMSVQAAGTNLRLVLELNAAIDTALPLPGGAKHWMPREARLDGKLAYIHRDKSGNLWLLAPAGYHRVELVGELPAGGTLQLPLPRKPRQVDVTAADWDVAGISDDNGVEDTLQLTRRIKVSDTTEAPTLPAFLRVERRLVLGLLWRVETTVSRDSPLGVPALAQIPLLPGEAVTTAGINVKDGKVLVNLGAQADSVTWSSTLKQSPELALVASKDDSWVESWVVSASTIWHVGATGIPPVATQNQDADLTFFPWPGEKLALKIDKPKAIPGQTLTVDSSTLKVTPGTRATDYELTLIMRSSRGVDHSITLPDGAILQVVKIDGQVRPIRATGRQLLLPLLPGKQTAEIVWRVDKGMSAHYSTLPVGLNVASVNNRLDLQMPTDRWLLLTSGPGVGPAILFWGKLLILLAVAVALGRYSGLPLQTRHWVLLTLGLTQVEWWAAAIVVAWFFALSLRGKSDGLTDRRWLFNLRQLGLALMTLIVFSILFYAVHGGLLGQPEMQVIGNDSDAGQLRWYVDRSGPELQSAWALSLPILAYRGLMLLWALWMAWSLLAWLKWGWGLYGSGGFWRRKMKIATSAAATEADGANKT